MWVIDLSSGYVFFNNERVGQLGSSEVLVFQCLKENLGQLKDKNELLDYAWPQKVVAPNSLTVAIKNIRKVFSVRPCSIEIKTHHGRGYSMHGDISEVSMVEYFSLNNEILLESREGDGLSGCSGEFHASNSENAEMSPDKGASFGGWFRTVRNFIFVLLVIISVLVSSLIWGYDKKIYCEEVFANVKLCGTKILYEKDRADLIEKIKVHALTQENRYSLYVYGYNYSPKNIVYYPIL